MNKICWLVVGLSVVAGGWMLQAAGDKIDTAHLLVGQAAFIDYRSMKPGTFRKITTADSAGSLSQRTQRETLPCSSLGRRMHGHRRRRFKVDLYATGLEGPRQIRIAPNGDFFVAESRAGQLKVFRGRGKDGKPEQVSVFATGLKQPFGIAFYPSGANPQWVYVGNTNSVVRFPYRNGDLKTSAAAETLVPDLPAGGGHWTRDVMFSEGSQPAHGMRMRTRHADKFPSGVYSKCCR